MIYNILFFFFALLYVPSFFMKGKHKGGVGSRFGFVPEEARRRLAGRQVIWVHGVSVGEVVQAVRLAGSLKRRFPRSAFLVTTTTAAGREVAERLLDPEDTLLYFPVDFGPCVRRFIGAVRPGLVVLLETEIWPNLIFELSRRRIPCFIVNGRISDRAFRRYRSVSRFLGRVLNALAAVSVQDAAMGERFRRLGASPERIRVTGNMKYDWQPPDGGEPLVERLERGWAAGGFFVIAGSTHAGEEEMLFNLAVRLRGRRPALRLLIAPRHLDRIAAIESEAARRGVRLERASCLTDGHPEAVVLDRMGLLARLYRSADAVFIGGSLVPAGGHNPVEAAIYERPILFGPHMHNFKEMAEDFKKMKAAIEVKNVKELETRLEELMSDPEKRRRMGRAARELVALHQGATERNAEVLAAAMAG